MLTNYYGQNWHVPVARPAAKAYIPVRQRISAPFFTNPVPVAPATPVIDADFIARYNALVEFNRTHRFVRGYVRRNGTVVSAYYRKAVA